MLLWIGCWRLSSTLYLIRAKRQIIGYYLLMTLALCSIYVIEKFSALVDIALKYRFGIRTFLSLMLYTLPAMVDLALPLACLVSIYFCLLAYRERRELLILAGAGIGPAYLAMMVVMAAVFAVILSLVFSGFVKPAASFGFRLTQQMAENQVLSKGIPGGVFYAQENKALYARSVDETSLREIRLFEFSDEQLDRMIFSNCAVMRVNRGIVHADLCGAQIYIFQNADKEISSDLAVVEVGAGPSRYGFDMSSIFRTPEKGRAQELSLIELVRQGSGKDGDRSHLEAAFSRVLGALTCLIAAALAVAAIAFTGPRTRMFILPVACGTVMVAAIFNNTLSSAFGSTTGLPTLLIICILSAVVAIILTVVLTRTLYDRLITPRMVKV
ncbi:LptF/LptG family permease [Pseudaminobacter sp. NGMCC 1.201702]|uniref:LptF/LptG family permease n=1 Tax=Pseudaminobacter sp. NGMCC 1.201702 TaxID=3391825 RepID=UPI0039EF5ECA